jgi:hypothetical protein
MVTHMLPLIMQVLKLYWSLKVAAHGSFLCGVTFGIGWYDEGEKLMIKLK